jgi:microsomal dipeptidase-like Zn-dependent dipeptidase
MLKKIAVSITILIIVAAALVFGFGPRILEDRFNKVIPHEPYEISEEAKTLHETLIAADLHSDTFLWDRNILKSSSYGHVDVPRLLEGKVAIQVFPTVTKSPKSQNYLENTADSDLITSVIILQGWPIRTWGSLYERARYQAEQLQEAADNSEGQLVFVRNRSELERVIRGRANGEQIVGGIMATEGSHALDGSLDNIQNLYDAGFRMMSLQHFFDNKLGGSLHGTSKSGLTEFGAQAVTEMNRLGIMIDVAHSSEAVVERVLALSTTPLVVSHTGIKGQCDTPRNISDDLMKQIAAGGGLIGIGYWDAAVCDPSPEGVAKAIVYAVELLGIDHVALGSDYDGATAVSFDVSELAALTQALLGQGLRHMQIRAVMGGNQIRYLQKYLPE